MNYYQEQQQYGGGEGYGPPGKQREQRGPTCEEDEETELKEKVIIPSEEFPGYNFVGSLLGPQGTILKGLQKGTNAKMGIYGKGSMRDKKKEDELALSDDAEHAHLKEPLHVRVEVKGPRAEAHWRMANALTEVYKFMVPPQHQQQQGGGDGYGFNNQQQGGYGGGDGGQWNNGPPAGRGGGPPRGAPRGRGGGPPRGRGGQGGPPRGGGGGYGGQHGGQQQQQQQQQPPQQPPQQQQQQQYGGNYGGQGGGAAHGGPPAPAANENYGYTETNETTNYQWDGNYNNTSNTANTTQTSNGFTLKRYNDSYNESY